MLMGEIIQPSGSEKSIANVAASPFYNLTTVLGDEERYPRLGGVSMDGMFRPFSTSHEASGIPHYESPIDSGGVNVDVLNPYKTGHDIGVVIRGETPPDNLNINTLADGGPEDVYRPLGLRAPLVLVGWGYDTNGKPVPNADPDNPGDEYLENHLQRQDMWKAGPLDVRWDDNKKLWAANATTGLIHAKTKSDGISGRSSNVMGVGTCGLYYCDRFGTLIDSLEDIVIYNTVSSQIAGNTFIIAQRNDVGLPIVIVEDCG